MNAVTAAKKLGDVEILVAGQGCNAVAVEAAKIADIKKVLLADDAVYKNFLAENLAALVAKLGTNYAYVIAPSTTTTGKNMLLHVRRRCLIQPNDLGCVRRRERGHFHAPDLCRQRFRHRAVQRQDKSHDHPHHGF